MSYKRAEKFANTHALLMESAKQQFETVGYERATIRHITKSIGMSTGAFFAHFRSKAGTYKEIYGHNPVSVEDGHVLYTILKELSESNLMPDCVAEALAKVNIK